MNKISNYILTTTSIYPNKYYYTCNKKSFIFYWILQPKPLFATYDLVRNKYINTFIYKQIYYKYNKFAIQNSFNKQFQDNEDYLLNIELSQNKIYYKIKKEYLSKVNNFKYK